MTNAPSTARLTAAFLLIWLPYIASTGLQERLEYQGPAGPALMLVALLMCWPAAKLLGRQNVFGLGLSRPVIVIALLTLAIGLAMQAVRLLAGASLGTVAWQPPTEAGFSAILVLAAMVTTFVPSLTEDILTRGFPIFAVRHRTVGYLSLGVISGLLYTVNHVWRFDWGVTEQVRLFAMGLAYALAAIRFRTLWSAVGLHWGWNLALALSPSAVSVETLARDADRLVGAGIHLVVAVVLAVSLFRRTDSESR